ncbi:MAG: hypothetical protein IH598_10510 [Bacteroidales bacterium]|nr:hypothetical protein [Bacteroidales bacterium]
MLRIENGGIAFFLQTNELCNIKINGGHMNDLLLVIAALSIIVYLIATIMIYAFLKKRNSKIESFIFVQLFLFKYVSEYKRITKKETGKTGNLFYFWIGSINLALLCVVLFFILTSL